MASLFAVIAPGPSPPLAAKIQESFPDKFLQVNPTTWFVVGTGTAQEVSDKLAITGEPSTSGSAIVLSSAGYWGRYSKNVWEWVATKLEEA